MSIPVGVARYKIAFSGGGASDDVVAPVTYTPYPLPIASRLPPGFVPKKFADNGVVVGNDFDSASVETVDGQSANGAAAGTGGQRQAVGAGAGACAVQFYQDHGIVAGRERVGRSARLGITVDNHRVSNVGQRRTRGNRNRMYSGSGNVEVDVIRPARGIKRVVGGQNGLAERYAVAARMQIQVFDRRSVGIRRQNVVVRSHVDFIEGVDVGVRQRQGRRLQATVSRIAADGLRKLIVYAILPSTMLSGSPVTVTICGLVQ